MMSQFSIFITTPWRLNRPTKEIHLKKANLAIILRIISFEHGLYITNSHFLKRHVKQHILFASGKQKSLQFVKWNAK